MYCCILKLSVHPEPDFSLLVMIKIVTAHTVTMCLSDLLSCFCESHCIMIFVSQLIFSFT